MMDGEGYRRGIILSAFFLSGMSALIYESAVFAVSAVLSAFMAGLAAGGLAAGRNAPLNTDNHPYLEFHQVGYIQ